MEADGDKEIIRGMVMGAVRSHFRPEFINRIDEFIIFDPLGQDQLRSIVRLQVGPVGCVRFGCFLLLLPSTSLHGCTVLLTCVNGAKKLAACGQAS